MIGRPPCSRSDDRPDRAQGARQGAARAGASLVPGARGAAAQPASTAGAVPARCGRPGRLRPDRQLGRPLELGVREPTIQPSRELPGALAHQLHERRHEEEPDHRRVDEDRAREADADQLQEHLVVEREGPEHGDHDRGGGRDHAGGGGEALRHRARRIAMRGVELADAADEEHLVVHREPEQDREHQHRDEGWDRHLAMDPDELADRAALGDRGHHAVRREDRQQVQHRGLDRHEDRAEGDEEQEAREPGHPEEQERESVGRGDRLVPRLRRPAADLRLGAGARDQVVAHRAQQLRRLAGGRGGPALHGHQAEPAVGGTHDRSDGGDARILRDARAERREGPAAVAVDPRDHLQRAGDARAEALRHELGGLARLRADRIVHRARVAEAHARERGGEAREQQHRDERGDDRPALHATAPCRKARAAVVRARRARGDRCRPALVRTPRTRPWDAQPLDARAGHREQRGEEGDRREHDGEHADARRECDADQVRQPHEEQAEHRDHDRAAGDDHRAAGRSHRVGDRILRARADLRGGAVAREDQQGVVDADADADHDGHRRRPVRRVDRVRHEPDERAARADTEQRGGQREPGGHDRPEGEQQDHERHGEPDALRRHAAALGLGHHLTAEPHGDGIRRGSVRHLQQLRPAVERHLGAVALERDLEEAVPAIGRDARCRQIGPAHVADRGRPREHALHVRPGGGRPHAAVGVPGDEQRVDPRAGEVLGDEVLDCARIAAGGGVVDRPFAGDLRTGHDRDDEDEEPGEHDRAATPGGEASEPCEAGFWWGGHGGGPGAWSGLAGERYTEF
ncbi:MAG: hypothetical protein PGN13_11545 [Patulibacter minatonensis]